MIRRRRTFGGMLLVLLGRVLASIPLPPEEATNRVSIDLQKCEIFRGCSRSESLKHSRTGHPVTRCRRVSCRSIKRNAMGLYYSSTMRFAQHLRKTRILIQIFDCRKYLFGESCDCTVYYLSNKARGHYIRRSSCNW